MDQKDQKEMKKNAQFLIDNMSGKEIPGKAVINVRYKKLVDFAKVYGISDPKYVGSEEDGIIACHAFANHFTVKALYKLLIGIKIERDGELRLFLKDPGKLLHAGQIYNWEDCVDVKPRDKLTVTGVWGNVWLVEKNMVLFAEFNTSVKNKNNELVCKPKVIVAVRPGGY